MWFCHSAAVQRCVAVSVGGCFVCCVLLLVADVLEYVVIFVVVVSSGE